MRQDDNIVLLFCAAEHIATFGLRANACTAATLNAEGLYEFCHNWCYLQIYTPAGRRMFPAIQLGAAIVSLSSDKAWRLLAVCQDGSMQLWDMHSLTSILTVSLQALLTQAPSGTAGLSYAELCSAICMLLPSGRGPGLMSLYVSDSQTASYIKLLCGLQHAVLPCLSHQGMVLQTLSIFRIAKCTGNNFQLNR